MSVSQTITNNTVILSLFLLSCHCHRLSPITLLYCHISYCHVVTVTNNTVISSLFLHCHAVTVTDYHYLLSFVTLPILFSHLASLRLFNMSHAAFLFHSSSILGCVLQGMDWTSWKRKPNNPLISSHWLIDWLIWLIDDWCQHIITFVEHIILLPGNLLTIRKQCEIKVIKIRA